MPAPGWLRVGARRYGNSLVLVVGMAVLTVLLPEVRPTVSTTVGAGGEIDTGFVTADEAVGTDGGGGTDGSGGSDGTTGGGSSATGGTGSGGTRSGRTGTGAGSGGTTSTTTRRVATKCRSDGRQWGISLHMPPCTPVFTGDNGGATSLGVTGDKITLVRVFGTPNAAREAALRTIPGAGAELTAAKAVQETMLPYFNQHYETYRREVVLVDYYLTGDEKHPEAQRADAKAIAKDKKAFAVITSNDAVLSYAFIDELAANGVICIACSGWPLWRAFYKKHAGYAWTAIAPVLDELFLHGAEYVGKRLARRPARWAGNPTYLTQTRTFGLIWLEGDPGGSNPESASAKDAFVAALAQYGVTLSVTASYNFAMDGSNSRDITGAITAMAANGGVTTVICLCDSFTTTAITTEATSHTYFPEWFFPGMRNMDVNTAARTYDQRQWQHAFGLSAWATPGRTSANTTAFREYKHQVPDAKPGDEHRVAVGVSSAYGLLFTGIHMAGPKLSPATFAQGLYNVPPSGGFPKEPLFDPDPDNPTDTRDVAEIWWDTEATGPDELGQSTPNGLYRRVNYGKRYRLGQWPTTEPHLFDKADPGAIFFLDENPAAKEHEQDGHRHGPNPRCRSCI